MKKIYKAMTFLIVFTLSIIYILPVSYAAEQGSARIYVTNATANVEAEVSVSIKVFVLSGIAGANFVVDYPPELEYISHKTFLGASANPTSNGQIKVVFFGTDAVKNEETIITATFRVKAAEKGSIIPIKLSEVKGFDINGETINLSIDNGNITIDDNSSPKPGTSIAVALLIGSPNAIIGNQDSIENGTLTKIDGENTAVTPVVVNGRTLVPSRFLIEKFGGTVDWNGNTQTITIVTNDSKNVQLKLGSDRMTVNGNQFILDIPAQTIEGRTMLPLRAFVENALGKKLFYDNRGLIVISDDENLLAGKEDVIQSLINLIKLATPTTPIPTATPVSTSSKIIMSGTFDIQQGKLIKYTGTDSIILVPNNVTSIEKEAFRDNKSIKTVVIPNSITSLGTNCFRGCSNLSAVFMSDNINNVGDYAFYASASDLTIYGKPKAMKVLNNYRFVSYEGSSFTLLNDTFEIVNGVLLQYFGNENTVAIPDGAKIVANNVFNGRTDIRNVSIPNSVIIIDYNAFRDCQGLRSIIIPNSVTTIGSNSFRGCTNLRAAFVTSSISHLGDYCFYATHSDFTTYGQPNAAQIMKDYRFIFYTMPDFSLSDENWEIVKGVVLQYKGISGNVSIPNGAEIISQNVFNGRTDLTNVTIPASMRVIENNAFRDTGLKNITLPSGLLTIGHNTFRGCTNLKSAYVPDSVTSIGDYVFYATNTEFVVTGKPGSVIQDYCSKGGIKFAISN